MSQDKQKNIVQSSQSGFFNELVIRIKLVIRLMADPRVNFLYKLLPISSLVYFILPTDLVPLIPVDDAVVIWLATYLFVELSPPDVVQEHLDELRQTASLDWQEPSNQMNNTSSGDIIDAEYKEVEE